MNIRPATRQGVRPLIALYGESGSGKTYSSLLLARGFAGPSGKIVMIDTESGNGELYADQIPGGYDVFSLEQPFSPKRYVDAMMEIENSGAAIGVMDSGSHEWEGMGGVCEMADDNEEHSGKKGLNNWRKPKIEHKLFILKLLQSKIPWIICLRAHCKTRQGKANGKTEIVKDDFPTPIQSGMFIFECTAHGLIDFNHRFQPRQVRHEGLAKALPNNTPFTIEHGAKLAAWCASGGAVKPASTIAPTGTPDKKAILLELRTITESVHGWKKGMTPEQWDEKKDGLEFWLVEKSIISDTERLVSLDAVRLADVIAKARGCL